MQLPEWPPLFRDAWEANAPSTEARSSYRSERQHLAAWLGEYDTAGYYGRKTPGRDARFFYTHFNDAYGLAWLAEALGIEATRVREGMGAIEAAGTNVSAQAGAFRRIIDWNMIEPKVRARLDPKSISRRTLMRYRRPR